MLFISLTLIGISSNAQRLGLSIHAGMGWNISTTYSFDQDLSFTYDQPYHNVDDDFFGKIVQISVLPPVIKNPIIPKFGAGIDYITKNRLEFSGQFSLYVTNKDVFYLKQNTVDIIDSNPNTIDSFVIGNNVDNNIAIGQWKNDISLIVRYRLKYIKDIHVGVLAGYTNRLTVASWYSSNTKTQENDDDLANFLNTKALQDDLFDNLKADAANHMANLGIYARYYGMRCEVAYRTSIAAPLNKSYLSSYTGLTFSLHFDIASIPLMISAK